MTRRLAKATAGVMIMTLAACTSADPQNNSAPKPGSAASEGPTYAALSAKEAERALLKLGDLPTGFSRDRSDEEESEVTFKSGDPACRDYVEGAYGGKEAGVNVSRLFMKDAFGPFINNGITVRDESDAKGRMDKVIAALDDCERFVDGSDDSKVEVAPVSFPKLGEQSVAVRLTFESQEFEIVGTFVSARVGGNIVSVGDAGLTGGVGADELEKLARVVVSRVEKAARE